MCMEQFYVVLGNCRIPGLPEDSLRMRRASFDDLKLSSHICVFVSGQVFEVACYHPDSGQPCSVAELSASLDRCLHLATSSKTSSDGVGVCTSLPRDDWAKLYGKLRRDPQNADVLDSIESSLIVVCLDKATHVPLSENQLRDRKPTPGYSRSLFISPRETANASNTLHGFGPLKKEGNSSNRWFDKTIQLITSRDGSVGVNFEHTPSDAGAIIALVNAMLTREKQGSIETSDSMSLIRSGNLDRMVRTLAWNLDSADQEMTSRAGDNIQT
ncbi:unnamed protein product [Protopolystoma xenopodis]|uniref:Choline/carnitine acyltransferase domain-containing protein n=1 Tax=Protopolystoma xenopodis TaxID=117903 RepID=A0A3S5B0J1_9PLAT|nr:unnamed protein product [Protopolystoma xenopodis]